MPVQLGAQSEHGFDQPLGLLSDCHRRIEQFLDVLAKIAETSGGTALSDEHRRAAEAALKYFDVAAPRHTQDEEQSLFPRLRGLDHPQVKAALEQIAELEADHGRADALHQRAAAIFRAWLHSGPLSPDQHRELSEALASLRAIYAGHIQIEDRTIFPLAAQVLDPGQLKALGAEMAERRGLPSEL